VNSADPHKSQVGIVRGSWQWVNSAFILERILDEVAHSIPLNNAKVFAAEILRFFEVTEAANYLQITEY
jgi:hypothetical protein